MVECKNTRSEKVAKYLKIFTDSFKIWIREESVYALFEIDSLSTLRELRKRMKKMKNAEIKFIKIWSVRYE